MRIFPFWPDLCYKIRWHGAVAELADAGDLKSSGVAPRVGSSPTRPTKQQ